MSIFQDPQHKAQTTNLHIYFHVIAANKAREQYLLVISKFTNREIILLQILLHAPILLEIIILQVMAAAAVRSPFWAPVFFGGRALNALS